MKTTGRTDQHHQAATRRELQALWWKLGAIALGLVAYRLGRRWLGLGDSPASWTTMAVGYTSMAIVFVLLRPRLPWSHLSWMAAGALIGSAGYELLRNHFGWRGAGTEGSWIGVLCCMAAMTAIPLLFRRFAKHA